MRAGIAFALLVSAAACSGPVLEPRPVSGEAIAFGAGPSGARNACFTCHGLAGEGAGASPRLAGLEAGYLTKQLFDYASGERSDPVMGPIARAMSDRDRRAVAHYYAARAPLPALVTAPPHVYAQGDAARGLRACADCHGAQGRGRGPGNPALAGQPAAYTIEQLRRWKFGERRNDPRNVMSPIARALTDEEIEAVAAYLAGAETRDGA
ncbi:MAG TPA: c-type cytochrome [Candidatus Binatia bacterium]|nr:c-type cytochrome [Candidatus Binatia bacterium]